jgi:hypothetical protein
MDLARSRSINKQPKHEMQNEDLNPPSSPPKASKNMLSKHGQKLPPQFPNIAKTIKIEQD